MSTGPEFGSLRSDDDQWDIVSSVGYTALLVAGWRAVHALSPRPLVRDEYAKVFIAAAQDPYLANALANPGSNDDETAFPRLYGVQTRFFDDFFGSAGAAGIRQAVIVAAGLDSRAYRLEWPPGQSFSRSTCQRYWPSRRGCWASMVRRPRRPRRGRRRPAHRLVPAVGSGRL